METKLELLTLFIVLFCCVIPYVTFSLFSLLTTVAMVPDVTTCP